MLRRARPAHLDRHHAGCSPRAEVRLRHAVGRSADGRALHRDRARPGVARARTVGGEQPTSPRLVDAGVIESGPRVANRLLRADREGRSAHAGRSARAGAPAFRQRPPAGARAARSRRRRCRHATPLLRPIFARRVAASALLGPLQRACTSSRGRWQTAGRLNVPTGRGTHCARRVSTAASTMRRCALSRLGPSGRWHLGGAPFGRALPRSSASVATCSPPARPGPHLAPRRSRPLGARAGRLGENLEFNVMFEAARSPTASDCT